MRIPKWAMILPALFFVQQMPGVAALGVDLPLIFTALMGLRTTPSRAAGWGFLAGLLQDLLSAGWIGPNTIAKTLVGIFSSLAQRHIYREKVFTQVFLIFWASLLHQFLVWQILNWDGSVPTASNALSIGLRNVLATSLVGVLVCFVVVRFRRRRMDPATA